jgi:hypothetical protein
LHVFVKICCPACAINLRIHQRATALNQHFNGLLQKLRLNPGEAHQLELFNFLAYFLEELESKNTINLRVIDKNYCLLYAQILGNFDGSRSVYSSGGNAAVRPLTFPVHRVPSWLHHRRSDCRNTSRNLKFDKSIQYNQKKDYKSVKE